MKRLIVIGFLFWGFSGSVRAQNPEFKDLCALIKKKVVIVQNPSKVTRDEVFSSDCQFRFSVGRTSVSVGLEVYLSPEQASSHLKSLKESFIGFDVQQYEHKNTRDIYKNIFTKGIWDDAAAYKNKFRSDHFALLRRDKYLITILAEDFSVLTKTERLFRSISFIGV